MSNTLDPGLFFKIELRSIDLDGFSCPNRCDGLDEESGLQGRSAEA